MGEYANLRLLTDAHPPVGFRRSDLPRPVQPQRGLSFPGFGDHSHPRPEITIGPLATFARETPEDVVRAPCVERDSPQ
ncbi:hypothetical protein ACUXK4_004988 [Methylorubrum extorquens]